MIKGNFKQLTMINKNLKMNNTQLQLITFIYIQSTKTTPENYLTR